MRSLLSEEELGQPVAQPKGSLLTQDDLSPSLPEISPMFSLDSDRLEKPRIARPQEDSSSENPLVSSRYKSVIPPDEDAAFVKTALPHSGANNRDSVDIKDLKSSGVFGLVDFGLAVASGAQTGMRLIGVAAHEATKWMAQQLDREDIYRDLVDSEDPVLKEEAELVKQNFRFGGYDPNSATELIGQGLGTTVPIVAASAVNPALGYAAGSLMTGGGGVEDARMHQATQDETYRALAVNSALGLLEGKVAQKALNIVDKVTAGQASSNIAKAFHSITGGKLKTPQAIEGILSSGEQGWFILKNTGEMALYEGLQETAQQLGLNWNALLTYDPDRQLTEGLGSSATVGGGVGGILGGVMSLYGLSSKRIMTIEERNKLYEQWQQKEINDEQFANQLPVADPVGKVIREQVLPRQQVITAAGEAVAPEGEQAQVPEASPAVGQTEGDLSPELVRQVFTADMETISIGGNKTLRKALAQFPSHPIADIGYMNDTVFKAKLDPLQRRPTTDPNLEVADVLEAGKIALGEFKRVQSGQVAQAYGGSLTPEERDAKTAFANKTLEDMLKAGMQLIEDLKEGVRDPLTGELPAIAFVPDLNPRHGGSAGMRYMGNVPSLYAPSKTLGLAWNPNPLKKAAINSGWSQEDLNEQIGASLGIFGHEISHGIMFQRWGTIAEALQNKDYRRIPGYELELSGFIKDHDDALAAINRKINKLGPGSFDANAEFERADEELAQAIADLDARTVQRIENSTEGKMYTALYSLYRKWLVDNQQDGRTYMDYMFSSGDLRSMPGITLGLTAAEEINPGKMLAELGQEKLKTRREGRLVPRSESGGTDNDIRYYQNFHEFAARLMGDQIFIRDGLTPFENEAIENMRQEHKKVYDKLMEHPQYRQFRIPFREYLNQLSLTKQLQDVVTKRLQGTLSPVEAVMRLDVQTGRLKKAKAAPAWHGSRHRWDNLDFSKVGAGEGSQAFGWGIYVAENPKVAHGYRLAGLNHVEQTIADSLAAGNTPRKTADIIYDTFSNTLPYAELLAKAEEFAKNPPGYLYELDIPDSHIDKMLDWDKAVPDKLYIKIAKKLIELGHSTGSLRDAVRAMRENVRLGAELYEQLAQQLAPPNPPDFDERPAGWSWVSRGDEGSKRASLLLDELGIPGIKYLDQQSRKQGDGTRNLVLFSDVGIKVLKRNNQPILPPSPAKGSVSNDPGDPPPPENTEASEGDFEEWNTKQDTFSKFYSWGLGVLHLAKLNPHIQAIQNYVQLLRDWSNTRGKSIFEAQNIHTSWRRLGKEQANKLSKVLLEETLAGEFKSAEELFKDLDDEALAVRDEINRYMQEAVLKPMEQTLIEEAIRKYKSDPFAQAVRLQEITERFTALRGKPYFPLMRFGKFALQIRNAEGKQIFFESFESSRERDKAVEDWRRRRNQTDAPELKGAKVKAIDMTDHMMAVQGMPIDFAKLYVERLQQVGAPLTDEQLKQLEDLSFETSQAKGFMKQFQKRRGVAGFSTDGLRAFASYAITASNHIARVRYAPRLAAEISNLRAQAKYIRNVGPESESTVKRDQMGNWLDEHFQYLLSPENEWAGVRSAAFAWHLGFNLKTAVLNTFQVPMVGYPYLAARFGDAKAVAEIVKANKDLAVYFGKHVRGKPQVLEPGVLKMLQKGKADGWLDEGMTTELAMASREHRLDRMLPGNVAKRFIQKIPQYSAVFFHTAEKINRNVMAIATYRLALEKGMDHDAAVFAAERAIEDTQFIYERWNRAPLFRGRKGAALIFMSFVQNTMVFAAADPGAMRWWMMQLIMGGLIGLPFAKDLLDLLSATWNGINHLFNTRKPYKDFELEIRRQLVATIGEWGLNPDLILHGISKDSMGIANLPIMENFPLPRIDLSGSMSMGDILPLTENVKSLAAGQGLEEFLMKSAEGIGGAGIAPIMSITRAMASNDPNEWRRWEKALPTALRSASQALRIRTEGAETTQRGDVIARFDPHDMRDNAELILKAMSFQPKALTEGWELEIAQREYVGFYKVQKSSLLRDYNYARVQKDREGIADARAAIIEYNKNVPFREMGISNKEAKQSFNTYRSIQKKAGHDVAMQREYRRLENELSGVYDPYEEEGILGSKEEPLR